MYIGTFPDGSIGKVTIVKFEQSVNAPLPILVTDLGIYIVEILQPLKAFSPIVSRLPSGIIIVVNPEQS